MSVAFHLLYDFHDAMLAPVYAKLKGEVPCIITKSVEEVVEFRPQVLIVADQHYSLFRKNLPNTVIVWVRHGFSTKGTYKKAIQGCDFACVSSAWVRRDCIRQGITPRLGFWETGFVPMDSVLRPHSGERAYPKNLSPDNTTVLYAPTYNPALSSAVVLGEHWITELHGRVPNLNVIIKPHPVTGDRNPDWIAWWTKESRKHHNTYLVQDSHASAYDYFSLADILLTDISSVMFYFLVLDRPIILVNNKLRHFDELYDPDGVEWKWRDMGLQISTNNELAEAVRECISQPESLSDVRSKYRDRVFGDLTDGRAAERIADKVLMLLESV